MMWRPISELPESWKDGRELLIQHKHLGIISARYDQAVYDQSMEQHGKPFCWDSEASDTWLFPQDVTHFAPPFTPENDPVGKLVEAVELVNEMFDIPTLKEAIAEYKKVMES